MSERAPDGDDRSRGTAAAALLTSLGRHGVDYVFSNLGTDHTPILEAKARLEEAGRGDEIPDLVTCQHEFVAMSAAHGYAMTTGDPQAVLVHVDVGTQNLGAAMHNAHRANVPVFVVAGLAPVTDRGYPGSRDHPVHYFQDTFDQPGIVREYCRWTGEYRPPADPDALVSRALDRATGDPAGPVYLTAAREALETAVDDPTRERSTREAGRTRPDADDLASLRERLADAHHPLVITSGYDGDPAALATFAETAGAAVVEHVPTRLCFPRDHPLHAGFDPTPAFDRADLVLVVASDVPWVPADGGPGSNATGTSSRERGERDGAPAEETPVVQIDTTPTKPAYPHWDFPVTETLPATPETTLRALTDRLDREDGAAGREAWRSFVDERRAGLDERLDADREAGHLTPAVLSDALVGVLGDSAIVVEDAVTSRVAILDYLELSDRQEFYWKGGSGLGWAGGAAVGAKLAHPGRQVVSLVGDGSYLFGHPSTSALFAAGTGAPTLTVIYDNAGWSAVSAATEREHPEGAAVDAGVPLSRFDPVPDLSAAATVVDAHTASVEDVETLQTTLEEAAEAVADGRPAVVDVRLDEPVD